jgi:hypothetical protein
VVRQDKIGGMARLAIPPMLYQESLLAATLAAGAGFGASGTVLGAASFFSCRATGAATFGGNAADREEAEAQGGKGHDDCFHSR